MKHIPGARKAKLVGEPVFNKQIQPIRPALLKQWNEQNGMNTELILSPMPYTMMLGRKPQKKNQTA